MECRDEAGPVGRKLEKWEEPNVVRLEKSTGNKFEKWNGAMTSAYVMTQ